jgi:heme-degrading monooxygenase HmoA
MLLERSELLIKEGEEDSFHEVMQGKGIGLLTSIPGVVSVSIGRGVENPEKFMLLVEWETMDAHIAYRETPICVRLRELIGPYMKGGSMEHFRMG